MKGTALRAGPSCVHPSYSPPGERSMRNRESAEPCLPSIMAPAEDVLGAVKDGGVKVFIVVPPLRCPWAANGGG